MFYVLCVLLVSLPGLQAQAHCEHGWTLSADHCYRYVNTQVSQGAAVNACNESDALLASIQSNDTETFLVNLTKPNQAWIGLNRVGSTGDWMWASGEPVEPYENWAKAEPGDSETCARLKEGQWWGIGCHVTYGYVCEKKALESSAVTSTSSSTTSSTPTSTTTTSPSTAMTSTSSTTLNSVKTAESTTPLKTDASTSSSSPETTSPSSNVTSQSSQEQCSQAGWIVAGIALFLLLACIVLTTVYILRLRSQVKELQGYQKVYHGFDNQGSRYSYEIPSSNTRQINNSPDSPDAPKQNGTPKLISQNNNVVDPKTKIQNLLNEYNNV
ncbi:hypothetical protein CAPTEDRAFT_221807 [Capitella teleta]|uniref:C-type lectin domain-containing protein n=1 Tax=Capitella teleta TaxID=283909 RepID=R7ULW2_CAPTE|nr:hypothetical protein CAPTEDRAFT_221807 [Capitella teleta]|eukprot:ELU04272.1 hypothetical protein CAPTEDRAFT_221807 [Capitella teleta]